MEVEISDTDALFLDTLESVFSLIASIPKENFPVEIGEEKIDRLELLELTNTMSDYVETLMKVKSQYEMMNED